MAWASHVGLLVTAFLAATILPGSSEALLATLVVQLPSSKLSLLLVATVGNTAGACVNWYLGRAAMNFGGSRWFPATIKHIERASRYLNRFGSWPLLFSWLPIIGDPLTVAAGVLRITSYCSSRLSRSENSPATSLSWQASSGHLASLRQSG